MSGARRAQGLALALAAVGVADAARAQEAQVMVRPPRARVGDPVVLVATVRAPAGARIEFPPVVNAAESVEALDPRVVRTHREGALEVAEATWRLVAWDTGQQALPLGDAVVTVGSAVTRLPLATQVVAVETVLPRDTARRDPRPARDVVDTGRPWYDVILPWLVPLVVLALAWGIWRRNRRERPPAPTEARDAEAAFARLEAARLGGVGEPGREVAIATEIVRDFLAARYDGADVALTTAEVTRWVAPGDGAVRAAVADLLAWADLVKYARRPVNADEAAAFVARARSVVRQCGARVTHREAA